MHAAVRDWVAACVDRYDLAPRRTLELGAYDVNGSVRSLFNGLYVATDSRAGPGVDQVADAHDLPFPSKFFGVVVATEMLEHDSRPWRSVYEAHRVLLGGGFCLVTTRGFGSPLHEYPDDFWRFTPSAVEILLTDADFEVVELAEDPQEPGVFALGRRT